jgi:hypothetical protein
VTDQENNDEEWSEFIDKDNMGSSCSLKIKKNYKTNQVMTRLTTMILTTNLFINFSRQHKYKHIQTGRWFRSTNTA